MLINNALNNRALNPYGSTINDSMVYNRLISLIEQYNRLASSKGLPLKKVPVYTSRINETLITRAINTIINDIDELRYIKDKDNGPPLRYGVYDEDFPDTNGTFVIDSWKYTVKTVNGETFLNVTINDKTITEMPEDLPFNVITDASGNTLNITDMSDMFAECSNLVSIDLSNFNTSNITNMTQMFALPPALTSITFGDNFNTSEVKIMDDMFINCTNLENIKLYEVSANLLTKFPGGATTWYVGEEQLTNAVWKDNWGTGPVTFTRTIQQT